MRRNHADRELEHYRSLCISLGSRCQQLQQEIDSLKLQLLCRTETDVYDLYLVGARMN